MNIKTIHANLIEIDGRGVLITGEHGSGKTRLTIDLVGKGARFVADDAVVIAESGDIVEGYAPAATRGMIATDDQIVQAADLFGAENIIERTVITDHIAL